MKVIVNKLSSVYRITGKQNYDSKIDYVKTVFCVIEHIEDGLLLFNTLSRELLLLTYTDVTLLTNDKSSTEAQKCIKYLVEHWFLISQYLDDNTICYMAKNGYIANNKPQSQSKFESYTILTTTMCNARCHYCYEYGIRKYSMDKNTSMDVAQYIKNTASPNISLRWFGGEPLCNTETMDIITKNLLDNGVNYYSTITSNGFLFDTISDNTIVNIWKLKSAQITIDGTHENYNTTKNYIDTRFDPYCKVMDNITRLLKLDIRITIRLNISNSNVDDMINLIDDLHMRFAQFSNFKVYSYPLFEGVGNPPYNPTDSERENLYDGCIRVSEKIYSADMGSKRGLPSILNHHCMADSGRSIVILPDGKTTFCQHYNDDEICGSIYEKKIDPIKQNEWKVFTENNADCTTCFYYPLCCKLEKCPNEVNCSVGERKYREFQIKSAMKSVYSDYKNQEESNDD